MERQQEMELRMYERAMTYTYKTGRRTVLKGNYYYIYDDNVLIAN